MPKYLTIIGFLLVVPSAFAILPLTSPIGACAPVDAVRSDGTYHFYYDGDPMWQWNFPSGGYIGVNFDPTDNEGDTTYDPYEVTYVDSLWNYDPDDSYEVTLYICEDDGGVPDFDNPLYESDPYEPAYYIDWDEHEVTPPVPFYGEDICWVVFYVPEDYGHPISDGDGNSGHSWISEDGYDWELMDSTEAVDWCIEVYAEPGEPPDDNDPPYVTDQYPVDDDWPSGVPPDENSAGCHWLDEGSGVDADALSFVVYDDDSNPVEGTLTIDDSDIHDVTVLFEADDIWVEGETYTVETECYDLAGNSGSAFWIFSTGFLTVEEKSLGEIKAGYAE